MPNTYTKVYLHFVFATKYRAAQISPQLRPRMEAYLSAVSTSEGHHIMALYAMPDHVHLLLSFKISQAIPDFIRKLKTSSSKWASEQPECRSSFAWQEAYGCFSHGPESLEKFIAYINGQEEHHRKQDFQTEYRALLKRFSIEFDERYLFHNPE